MQHGRGAFVRTRAAADPAGCRPLRPQHPRQHRPVPFRAEAAAQGKQARSTCRASAAITPPADVAERLGLDQRREGRRPGQPLLHRRRAATDRDHLHSLVDRRAAPCSPPRPRPARGSIYERFAELGHNITRVREEITARMPRPDETATLAVPPGVPVIELLHTGIDQDGQPFEVTRFVMRADRSGLDYDIPIEEPE